MPENKSAPPEAGSDGTDGAGGGSEAEEAAWEMATGEAFRSRGELAEAATWYRRAANRLMDAGEDERAIAVAKLAAELAALDDAGRPGATRSALPDHFDDEQPTRVIERPSDLPTRERERSPWQHGTPGISLGQGATAVPATRNTAPSAPPRSLRAHTPLEASTQVRITLAEPSTQRPARANPSRASTRDPALSGRPLDSAVTAQSAKSRAPSVRTRTDPGLDAEVPTTTQVPAFVSGGTQNRPPSAPRVSPPAIASMVEEAVLSIEPEVSVQLTSGEASSPSPVQKASVRVAARLTESERIAARLPALPLFSDFAPERLRELSRQASIACYQAGEYLCESGAPEGPMFVLIDGAAWVGLLGSESPTAIVGAGDYIGEISALFGGPRTAMVQAQGNVEAVVLAPSLVRGLARDFPPFREALESSIRERLTESLPHLVPMFRRFETQIRADLFRRFDIVSVPEGALILSEGEIADALCVIAAGEAEIYGGSFGGTRAHKGRVGEALGLTSLLRGDPVEASARALRGMLIARMPRSRFREAVARYPEIKDLVQDAGAPGRGVLF